MTPIPDFVDISAGHAVPHDVDQHALIGLRETLGAIYVDPDFRSQYDEARRRSPGIVTMGYLFLTGPRRGTLTEQQVLYWRDHHRCELGALDWERDSYQHAGATVDMGIQPFSAVLRGLTVAREATGIDAGLYMSRYLASREVITALIARRTPFIWIAAYDGLSIPEWIVKSCRDSGTLLFHQYAGATIDRNRVLVGSLDQLHALAGRTDPPSPGPALSEGEPMTNLVPLTVHRVLDLAAGTVLERTPGGERYTTLAKPVTLGLLGATGTHYHVADGDAGVYVKRAGLTPRTADLNVGA